MCRREYNDHIVTLKPGHKIILLALLIISMVGFKPVIAADQSILRSAGKIGSLLAQGRINPKDIPNPHWKRNACIACHTSNQGASRANLRTRNSAKMCGDCHNPFTKAAFIHPTGFKIPKKIWQNMPQKFRRSLNRVGGTTSSSVTCMTCHDLVIQCLQSRVAEKKINPLFYRLGPYRDRVQLCFFCHKANEYKRFDPHKQIIGGRIRKKSCSLCHLNLKNLSPKTRLTDIKLRSSDDLTKLCINCHPWRPHPGWEIAKTKKKPANHLVAPSQEMIIRMEMMKNRTGVVLPLGAEDGKINCATCHNPHQKGVIKSKLVNAGADSKRRLRMKQSCTYCHEI